MTCPHAASAAVPTLPSELSREALSADRFPQFQVSALGPRGCLRLQTGPGVLGAPW